MEEGHGIIKICKMSENKFVYSWNFDIVEESLRSPIFRQTCEELLDYYLEFKKDYHFKEKVHITFTLKGYNVQTKICSVKLGTLRGSNMSFMPYNKWIEKTDIKSSVAKFEFLIPRKLLIENDACVFKIVLQLKIGLTAAVTPSSENESSTKTSSVAINEVSKNTPYADNPEELIQDLRCLYISGSMNDLEIHIGEDILQAHKIILCSRSPVFMKMMEHDCLETSSNSIIINDCSTHIFKIFLKYLYTGEIENRKIKTVMSLYSLSDKYDVPALRKASFKIIQSTFSSESVEVVADFVTDALQLAECHSDTVLKELAVNFIVKHFPLMSNKQSWKDLMRSDFELTSEILALVVTACQKMPIYSS